MSSVATIHHSLKIDFYQTTTSTPHDTDYLATEKIVLPFCSDDVMTKLYNTFYHMPNPRIRNKLTESNPISEETSCQEATWLWNHLLSNQNETETFLALFVGCNKGFDAVDIARLGTNQLAFSKQEWISKFRKLSDSKAVCSTDQRDNHHSIATNNHRKIVKRRGELHCIEPAQKTVELLQNVAREMNLLEYGFKIKNAAISNFTGSIPFVQSSIYAGVEFLSIESCHRKRFKRDCKSIPVYSLDDYMRHFVSSSGLVDVLSIDAEGYDFSVLQGGTLSLKRTKYLEFEVLNNGPWLEHGVTEAIELLQEHFYCYLAGKGRLYRMTDCYSEPALQELYNRNYWSNVACVNKREHSLVVSMEKLFQETIAVL